MQHGLLSCSCRAFNRCGREPLVFRRATTEEIYLGRYRLQEHQDAAYTFLTTCAQSGNPGALYGEGMVRSIICAPSDGTKLVIILVCSFPVRLEFACITNPICAQMNYFWGINERIGLQCLERSAMLGHTQSAYVLAMLLMCCQSLGQEEKGLNLIRGVRAVNGPCIMDLRLELVRFIFNNWRRVRVAARFTPIQWNAHRVGSISLCRIRNPWIAGVHLIPDVTDAHACMSCSCDFESLFFCALF